jgi:hypothetical protein
VAETEWREALQASAMAPLDTGFVVRINEIADAAARKAAGLENLGDEAPGAWWQRQSGLPGGVLSYELRPGANRPGPAELWARFDQAVDELGRAMAEHSVPAEQQALEAVSLVLHEIVDALLEHDGYGAAGEAAKRGEVERRVFRGPLCCEMHFGPASAPWLLGIRRIQLFDRVWGGGGPIAGTRWGSQKAGRSGGDEAASSWAGIATGTDVAGESRAVTAGTLAVRDGLE